MNQPSAPATLFDTALAEQETRNAAALTAIRASADDIAEAQRLVEALTARGARVRAYVTTFSTGLLHARCRIALWLTASQSEFTNLRAWLGDANITLTRLPPLDIGDITMYELTLRTQTLHLHVAFQEPKPARFIFSRSTPEAA